jgi:hypothetical protein
MGNTAHLSDLPEAVQGRAVARRATGKVSITMIAATPHPQLCHGVAHLHPLHCGACSALPVLNLRSMVVLDSANLV